jgi:sigma-B regulation protein RsbU (phosphoserine phosphatase)
VNWRLVIAIFYFLLGTVLWLLGTVIFKENPRNRVNRVTGFMLFLGGLGPLFAAVGTGLGLAATTIQSSSYYNLFYIWELFFPQLLLFSFVFPTEYAWVARFRRLKYLVFVPHVFHFFWVVFLARPDVGWLEIRADSAIFQAILAPVNVALGFIAFGLVLLFEFHLRFFSVINLLYILLAVGALWHGYRRLTNQRLRRQVRVVILGILSGVGLYAVAFIAPPLGLLELPEMVRVALTILALMIGSGAIAWAIIRYQFLDTRFIVRQSLVFSISSALLLGTYLLLITQASSFIKDLLEVQTPLIDVVFVVLVLVFFQPLKQRVDDVVQRLFLRNKADPGAILEAFSQEMTSVFDIDRLKQQMMAALTNFMFVERVFFATRHPESGGYILELSGLPREPFPQDDQFFVEVRERGRPAAFEEFVLDKEQTPMTEVLTRWGCRLVVPIIDRGNLTAILLLGEKVSGYRYGPEDLQLLATLANQLAVAFTNAVLYQDALEKQKLEEELNVARQIQLQLLPTTLPEGESFSIAAFSHPSRQVGGDYYDFFALPDDNLGIVIADISGKGVGAAILVSQLQAILRAEVRDRNPMSTILSNTNILITESTASDRFATLFYAEFDPARCHLTYSNAGHNYPIVVHSDGQMETLEAGGLLLGVSTEAIYETGETTLRMDDVVLFYTDGLADVINPEGEQYGEMRIEQFLLGHRHLGPEELKNKLVRDVSQFSLGAIGFDDMTMVILKIRDTRIGPKAG